MFVFFGDVLLQYFQTRRRSVIDLVGSACQVRAVVWATPLGEYPEVLPFAHSD